MTARGRARLVRLERGRRVGSVALPAAPFTLGRDPGCDLVLSHARVSRLHARIEPSERGHVLTDLQSANGTAVDGRPVHAPLELRSGDRIALAGEVELVYERRLSLPTAAWVAAAVGVALAFGLFLALRGDPVMEEATRLAAEGVSASQRGDYPTAKVRLKSAVGLMLREGRLDDVPRSAVMRTAMDRLDARLGGDVDLASVFERALAETRPVAPKAGHAACRLDRVPPDRLDDCIRERVRLVMIGLRQDPDAVPDDFYAQVGRRLSLEHDFIENALERAPRYSAMMSEELANAKMPPLLRYLALIESGYRVRARSAAGAVGLWQFLPGTARDYGLVVSDTRDDRADAQLSTQAAARYLRALAFEFGGDALLLALASYNRGENAVRRALKRLDDPFSERSYWALVEAHYLPPETAEYVSRFVAAAVAGEGGLPPEQALAAAGY
jgi:Transglycosylase SLT domain/FHA domain